MTLPVSVVARASVARDRARATNRRHAYDINGEYRIRAQVKPVSKFPAGIYIYRNNALVHHYYD